MPVSGMSFPVHENLVISIYRKNLLFLPGSWDLSHIIVTDFNVQTFLITNMVDITKDYIKSIADLTQNSKPLINMLTMLAEDNETHAAKIVEVIVTHLQQVESTKKLPTLYLIDSIIKNLPKSTYPGLFSHNIVSIFCNMFEQVDEKTRQCMFKVRQTWNQHFIGRKMYALDERVNNIDHAWPLSTPTSNISPIIHVNPKFLPQQREESLPLPDLPPIEDDEAEMRRLLIAKQAELLKLQQKRLELELKETETRLAQQKKISADLFVGVEPETVSQPGGATTALNTQLSLSQNKVYSPELTQALSRYDETGLADLEEKLISSFANSNRWRGGKLQLKFSFNYILLDPRVTKNLPSRMDSLGDEKSFKVFVDGIFYVGKGKGARPYSHLYEAIKQMKKPELQATDKVTRIQDIWSNNVGVVFLHCFQNVISDEAHTREACMIDAIGQKSLTNKNRGSYCGISETWSEKQRRNMGVYFLKKALQIFKGEGEKQLCRDDILKVGR